jgi:glutathione synthase/RimK-type ligase-like ATP-grasp enzyme
MKGHAASLKQAVALHQAGKIAEAAAMYITLARALVMHKRMEAAAGLLVSVLPSLRGDTDFIKTAAAIMIDAGHTEKAIAFLRPLTEVPGPVDGALLIAHAAACHQAGLDEEARRLTRRAVEAVPVHLTAKQPGQVLLVGILNQAPMAITAGTTPAHLHFTTNTPASLALKHNDEYRFLSILPEAQSAAQAFTRMPRPQVILNNWVNGEHLSTPSTLQIISDFADGLALPVLNHPRNAALTTRQSNAARLAGIPGLVIPRLIRIGHRPETKDLAMRLIAEEVGFPVILRWPFGQKGVGAEKIDSPAALSDRLATLPAMQLYAIEYIHNPVGEGAYRKIRAAVIGQDVFITHVRFGPRWKVHRERDKEKLAAFGLDSSAASHAARMITMPEETLGKPAMAALHAIRSRIPLDLYGIDFDMLPDGRVLFFEANAAMNLSLSDRPGREQTRAAMRAAVRRLFLESASQA